jgi:lysine 2,3-aminomutase
VNDDLEIMKKLMHGLLKIRVRPYYLYKCDRVKGTHHFQVSIKKGLEIINGLIGHTSGYAIPTFILDSPYGKIRLLPENISRNKNEYSIKTFNGSKIIYVDDED